MTEEYPDLINLAEDYQNIVMNDEEEFGKNMSSSFMKAVISTTTMSTTTTVDYNALEIAQLKKSVDTFFILVNSFAIFFLQGGFAFLEAGSVRSKNTTNILIKNILDCLIGAVAFWICGYMIASSDGNAFMGFDSNFLCLHMADASHFANWFFGFVFTATASTIVSGAVAERCDLTAYFVYSSVISAFVYPVCSHWAWTSEGWLAVNGYYDFAGSGVVHHLGGVCAFMGAVFLGPRIGRFDKPGETIPGHSVSLAALGAFILMFGFFSFNGATNASISTEEDRNIVGRAVINTMIGGASSGFTVLLVYRFQGEPKKWSLLLTINGILAGMISTCAFCNVAEPWATFIVGFIAGFFYLITHHAMIWFRIDDPLDAVAVHSGGGICGVLAAPFVIGKGGVFDVDDANTAMHQIWSQLVGLLVITGWSASISALIFFILKLNGKLRLPREIEISGCDVIKHGEAAYPPAAYEEALDEVPGSAHSSLRQRDVESEAARENEKKAGLPLPEDIKAKLNGSMKKTPTTPLKLNRSTIKKSPVTPLSFKKLKGDDTDSSSSGSGSDRSSRNVKTEKLSGIVNTAFVNDSMLCSDQNEVNASIQETHFNGEKTEEQPANESMYENIMEISKGKSQFTHLVESDRTLEFNDSKESTMI